MYLMKSYGGLTRGHHAHLTDTWNVLKSICSVNAQTSKQQVEMRKSRITRDEVDVAILFNWFLQHPPFCSVDLIMTLSRRSTAIWLEKLEGKLC